MATIHEYPLSQSQLGLFAECMQNPEKNLYLLPILYKMGKQVDMNRLRDAVIKAVEVHPFVNARMRLGADGSPVQYIDDADSLEILIDEVADVHSAVAGLQHPMELVGGRLSYFRLLKADDANYLFIFIHHIIADGTSLSVFFDDVVRFYNGEAVESEGLTALDFAKQEHEQREGQAWKDDEQWYMENFVCDEVDTQLLPDLEEKSYAVKSAEIAVNVDPKLVKQFCKTNDIRQSVFLTSAFALLLSRYTGDEQVLFSTIWTGRHDARLARSMGMFVSTLPAFYQLTADLTVGDLLRQGTTSVVETRSHSVFSFADFCNAQSVGSHVLFAYQGILFQHLNLAGEPVTVQELPSNISTEPFAVELFQKDDAYIARITYHAHRYSMQLLQQIFDSYTTVILQMMDMQKRLSEIGLLSTEQFRLLDSFNDTDSPYDGTQTIVSLFRQRARQHPDKTAVVFREKRYTYREVDAISDRIAVFLADKGLAGEDVVSILIPRCEWMAIASLGVIKAGCAYQPLDPSYPAERLNFMMNDAKAKFLIADETLRPIVNEYQGEVLLTRDFDQFLDSSALPIDRLPAEPRSDSLFNLLYTSGSTGVPKGCQWEHRNIVALCYSFVNTMKVGVDSVVSAYASYGFDASAQEIFASLTSGAELHVIPEELRLDLVALNDYFNQYHITHVFMTTQVAYQFATNFECPSLQFMVSGGEKLPSMPPPRHFTFANAYGPSESVCYVTAYFLKHQMENVPIGPAQPNVKLYIVDKFGHRLPVGACGELWIAGPQVSRGYLNRPEKTAEVFIDNPFCAEEKYNRVYRSGDIVRYLPDGNIQFVGRKDGQVKIRGFRIELKEVEAVIRQYPDVTDVTVQAFDEVGGGKFIAAYVVGNQKIDIQALNRFILEEKPPYMVPAVTMQIEKIPLNQNMKVDKKALPKPEKQAASDAVQENVPMNVLEQELHSMIAAIINNRDFGVTTLLGFAGLTSIMAIKLAIQMNKRFGVTLDSKSLAKTATLQTIENEILSRMMSEESSDGKTAELEAKHSDLTSIPLSYAQTGVYIECMKQPASTLYNIPCCITFSASTDIDCLATVLATLVKAHPIMSVHFDSAGTNIVQVLSPDQSVDVARSEMTEAQLAEYKHDFVQPFNLKQGPLYRFEIVRTESHVCLLADIHHLVIDGGSLDVFLRQLCDLMDGREIEPENATYADFVVAEKEAEQGEPFAEARQFFQQQLGACEGVTELQSDLTNPVEQGIIGEATSPLHFEAAEEFCRHHNMTPAHLTLAAVFYALARFTNRSADVQGKNEQLCITTISNGRSNLSIRNTVGMFVNTLALSAVVGDQRVIEFVETVSRTFDETLAHENYPFSQVAADYDLSAEIMFAYQIGVLDKYICNGTELKVENLELNVPKFRIAFYIKEVDNIPSVCIEYDNGRYSHSLMSHLAKAVSCAVDAFVAHPDASLLSVSLLDASQTAVLDGFNKTDVPYDRTQTIVSLFRRQAALTPDNECVVYHDARYTYRQVDEISERIAHYIAAQGLGTEDVVSVLIPRCEWMVIASLGVLKAGCAYQPLDPSYPAERLNFMMKDANARLLIADEELRHIVDEYKGNTLYTKDLLSLGADGSYNDVELKAPEPHSLFILLYTSGSTGVPKGCQLEHANVVAFCHWYQRAYELKSDCHVAAYASYGFDACMMDIYPAVTVGACVYIIGEDIRLNLPDLNVYFNDNNITHSFITTQVGYQFATNVDNHSLRCFAVGGEKLSALNPPQNYKMFNGYGPTECTVFTTNYQVKDYELDIPIGKPLDNLRLYIVDKQFNRLPLGAAGELWVSGPQVSRGYLNCPEKTAEVYIENPFDSDEQHARIYRTGDIVRYLPDGNIQFVGRKDGQVKIRGFRIELKEVEAVIRQYPGIRDATVQAFDYESGGKFIAAYIVGDQPIDVKSLSNFIGQQKPSYMIPVSIMQIDAIPLNQNQKVNRKALPAPVIQATDREYVAPANEIESRFCDIFAGILGIDKVGALDNFFELGGTSLMVTRVIIEADKYGYHIAYGDLFSHPTPQQLAVFVTGGEAPLSDGASSADAAFDYTPINALLMRNTLDAFRDGQSQPIGSVLLTGATGYLGIHVLKELIERPDVPVIYCLVRAQALEKAESRLKGLLYYYFAKNYKELFGNRLRIVLGDVTRDIEVDGHVDTVFNCAAVVKHFSKGTEIEDVNIGGAVHCVQFCLATGARLVHVSTYSTAGLSVNGVPGRDAALTEQKLFYGQFMDNQYVHSKFISERTVLEAAALHGLNAKVMRVGNLAPRSTDGEFQINFQTNSAMGRIRVFKMLGCYPYEMSDEPMEFSPINEVAHSIVLLSQTPRDCTLFHPYNNHYVYFGDVVNELGILGYTPQQVEYPQFVEALEAAKADSEKAKRLSSLLAYQDMAHGQESFVIPTKNTYTTQVLYRLGFRWSTTSWNYVDQFLKAIDGFDYFDE